MRRKPRRCSAGFEHQEWRHKNTSHDHNEIIRKGANECLETGGF
jgi:hypothetical protein